MTRRTPALLRLLRLHGLPGLTTALLLAACATPERTTTTLRFPMGDARERAQLEVQLPAGWSHQPTWDAGPRLALLRLSSKPPESPPQLRITPQLLAAQVPADRAALLALARRELAAAGDCAGAEATLREQPVGAGGRGLALACTRPAATAASALTPAVAGVVLHGRLAARFAILDHETDAQAQAWATLRSLLLTTAELSP